jgi:hypothetical protein
MSYRNIKDWFPGASRDCAILSTPDLCTLNYKLELYTVYLPPPPEGVNSLSLNSAATPANAVSETPSPSWESVWVEVIKAYTHRGLRLIGRGAPAPRVLVAPRYP